jgi:hypothetical protein
MIWIVLVTLAVVLLTLMLVKHRAPSAEVEAVDEFSDEELVQAAIELHGISQRLNVAWIRHELRGETNRLRRELAEEMQRVEALEADELSGE